MRYRLVFIAFLLPFSANCQQQTDSLKLLINTINNIETEFLRKNNFSNYINTHDENGKYPIHYAIEKGNTEIIKILLDQNADINAKDKEGYSPLHYAVIKEKIGLANYLIQKGAIKFILNNRNEFPVDIAYNLDKTTIVNLLLSKDSVANSIEKYRLWRNQFYLQSSTWLNESSEFKMAWINGSFIMSNVYHNVLNFLTEEEINTYKILEQDQKHFEYENEFQMDMNYKISLCDQLLAIIAKKTKNIEILCALAQFLPPSNQSQIQLQTLKTNLKTNPLTPQHLLNLNPINNGNN